MNIVHLIISLVISYLIGAIPTAYIAGRLLKNIDIRKHGSGNVGATNAFRVLGKGPGTIVLIIDIIKGIIPTTAVADIFGFTDQWVLGLLGLTAVAAHNWTIFLEFKGGKGIATSLGVLIGLAIQIPALRWVVLIVMGTWLSIFLSTGYVSIASLFASVALPISMVALGAPFVFVFISIILCLFIVFRHRSNIHRFLQGKENRVKLPFHKK